MKRERKKSRRKEKREEKSKTSGGAHGRVGPVVLPVLIRNIRIHSSSLGSITGLCYGKETKVWNEHANPRENRPGGQEQLDSPSDHYRARGVTLERLPSC